MYMYICILAVIIHVHVYTHVSCMHMYVHVHCSYTVKDMYQACSIYMCTDKDTLVMCETFLLFSFPVLSMSLFPGGKKTERREPTS